MMRWLAPALFMLTACAAPQDAPDTPQPVAEETGEENAPAIDIFAGCLSEAEKQMTGMALTDARPNLSGDARVIFPGDLYTQDYLPNRVNVSVDARGIITRVWCG